MNEYIFFVKGKQIVVLEKSDTETAVSLVAEGFEKQFEEVNAIDQQHALTRFLDIRKEKDIDHHNFLAGAGSMPLIGVLTAAADALLRKK
jgi:hypothetical protein